MRRKGRQRGRIIPILAAAFIAGGVGGWFIRGEVRPAPSAVEGLSTSAKATVDGKPTDVVRLKPAPTEEVPTTGVSTNIETIAADPIAELRRHPLRLPLEGARVDGMKGQFDSRRDAGRRPHEAVDLLAPRDTPVLAVEDGRVAKLFFSKAGGNTIYQFDPDGAFCYYYAHLSRYAADLREGAAVKTGQVIGYVGTSGNAPPQTPHLHFAIFELTADRHWWEGRALDPYQVYKK